MSHHKTAYFWPNYLRDYWVKEGANLTDADKQRGKASRWQKFYNHSKSLIDPFSSAADELQLLPAGTSQKPFRIIRKCQHGQILILPEYRETIRRIILLYLLKPSTGVVITGQPGIGKSVLLAYLLTVLLNIPEDGALTCHNTSLTGVPEIHKSAPVFFYTPSDKVLFFGGQCYFLAPGTIFTQNMLPEPVEDEGPPVWYLVDMDQFEGEPVLDGKATIFPVQSAAPNPIRYRLWSRTREAIYIGLPLWDEKHLRRGLEFNPSNTQFRVKVTAWLQRKAGLEAIHSATLLRCEQRGKLVFNGEDIETAIDLLFIDAIRRFGCSARDVYAFLVDPEKLSNQVGETVGILDMPELRKTVAFIKLFNDTGSMLSEPASDSFTVFWKTHEIYLKALARMETLSEAERAELFAYFGAHPKSSAIAANIYEPHVHEVIGIHNRTLLSLQRMRYKTINHTRAYIADEALRRNNPRITIGPRKPVRYHTLPGLADLDLSSYYVPTNPSNPFFDSFFFCDDGPKVRAVFSQISISVRHPGTTEEGYRTVREITRIAGLAFGKPVITVYIYVCPEFIPQEPRLWEITRTGFPEGDVYYLGVPLPYEQVEAAQAILDARQADRVTAKELERASGSVQVELDVDAAAGHTAQKMVPMMLEEMEGFDVHFEKDMEQGLRDFLTGFYRYHCGNQKMAKGKGKKQKREDRAESLLLLKDRPTKSYGTTRLVHHHLFRRKWAESPTTQVGVRHY
ncbi:hypothetical protein BDP27DRAFT_1447308 [Rhodocollybia butyracea]|uniref:Uncharacterized protein n=1 Tax=Rhodocollybia butyracea TaxID=206335 RepID=A0A9P5PVD9_9AGAR|nr:hypothetical protein BDP27DRAFT_1447308 [Rhodocollybia butyracea]